jgi:hypothetical protein
MPSRRVYDKNMKPIGAIDVGAGGPILAVDGEPVNVESHWEYVRRRAAEIVGKDDR